LFLSVLCHTNGRLPIFSGSKNMPLFIPNFTNSILESEWFFTWLLYM
jgi:hypothetical protein